MKTVKFIIALPASSALLNAVHSLTLNRPRTCTGSDNGYTFELTTIPMQLNPLPIEISVTITG